MSGKKRAFTAAHDIERKVSRYLLTTSIINSCLGIAIGTAVVQLGVDDAYIWGRAAFLLIFVACAGGIVGSVLVRA